MISNYKLDYPNIKTTLKTTGNSNILTISPLLPGFGFTLGNSIRRVLLSSIPGFAVTKVKINDITHEYQAVDGVSDDAMDIILNLKNLRASILTDEDSVTLTLNKDSEGVVTPVDFEKNSAVKIFNDDLYICTLNKDKSVSIEVEIQRGVGYVPLEQLNQEDNLTPQYINIDRMYSPVTDVALNVEKVRVGDKTNYDKIELTFNTDGTVDSKEIINYALNLSVGFFQNIKSSFDSSSDQQEIQEAAPAKKEKVEESDSTTETEGDEITLEKRIKGILEKNEITTNSELKERRDEVVDFAGISEKSLTKIDEYLSSL